jgi:hypothetical protein
MNFAMVESGERLQQLDGALPHRQEGSGPSVSTTGALDLEPGTSR